MKSTFGVDAVLCETATIRNGYDPAAHIFEHDKTVSLHRFEPPALTEIDSEQLLRELLRRIGEDPDREGLQQTPERIIRSWNELFSGYRKRSEDVLITQFHAEQYEEMVLLRDIEFYSTCEHHMLPFLARRISLTFRTRKLWVCPSLRDYSISLPAGSRCRNV